MPDTHCIEELRFEVEFGSADEAFEDQERTAHFARTRAPRILDEVFTRFARAGQVWRFDAVEIDLGPVDRNDLEAQWEAGLRDALAELFDAHGNDLDVTRRATAIVDPAAPSSRTLSREQAQLDTLLHFLRRGHLPWHTSRAERLASPVDQLAHEVLRDTPQALVVAWQASADWAPMVHRAVRQFPPTWLARLAGELARSLGAGGAAAWGRDAAAWVHGVELLWQESHLPSSPPPHRLWQGLLHAMLDRSRTVDRGQPLQSMVEALAASPGEQAALWRALQAVARRATDGTPPAPTATLAANLLQACLAAQMPDANDPGPADASAHDSNGSPSDERTRLRARLQGWLDDTPVGHDDADSWHDLLRADPSWARDTVLILGRQPNARRRMAHALPPAMLLSIAALWLAPAEHHLLQSALDSAGLWGHGGSAVEPAKRWEMTLTHLLQLPSPALFNAPDYLDGMVKQRSGREGRPVDTLMQALAADWRHGPAHGVTASSPDALIEAWVRRHLSARVTATDTVEARRSRLRASLAQGTLHGVEDAWNEALKVDAPWLQNRLRDVGRRTAMQHRMAREWGAVACSQLIGLWLPAPDRTVVMAAVHNPAFFALAGPDETRPAHHLWEHLLAHLLRLTPGTFFNADAYVRGLHERVERLNGPARSDTAPAPQPEPPSPDTPRARLEATLARGLLPLDEALWQHAFDHDAAWLRPTLHRLGRQLPVRHRMARGWHERALMQVVGLWWSAADRDLVHDALHSPCFKVLGLAGDSPAQEPIPAERTAALWEATLSHLFLGPVDTRFDVAAYVRDVVRHDAQARDLGEVALARAVLPHLPTPTPSDRPTDTLLRARLAELVPPDVLAVASEPPPVPRPVPPVHVEPVAAGEVLYIANAGLVLAGAYLERLLGMLGMVRDDAFVSPAAAKRAVHLLQYLATGEVGAPEPDLVLNKVLCGLGPDTPMRREFQVTAQESDAVDGLLRAMVSHWKILGHTTVAGLRESFLCREGHLSQDDDGWQLTVAGRSFDMLLDHLPWGYRLLKFHWMERPLHVDWR